MYTIPTQVKALSFDIWSTLMRGNSSYTWPRLEVVFGHLGILGRHDKDTLITAYKTAEKALDRQAEVDLREIGMDERISYVLALLGETGVAVPDHDTIIMLQKECGKLRVLPEYLPTLTEPDLVETLTALKAQGYRIGILSNTGMGDCNVTRPVLEHFGIADLLEVQLYSCEDGRAKPNLGLFTKMAGEFELEPREVLHIGDNIQADGPAVDAGMHSLIYAPQGVPEGTPYPFITSMKELLVRELVNG